MSFLNRRPQVHPAVVIGAEWSRMTGFERWLVRCASRNLAAACAQLSVSHEHMVGAQFIGKTRQEGPATRFANDLMGTSSR